MRGHAVLSALLLAAADAKHAKHAAAAADGACPAESARAVPSCGKLWADAGVVRDPTRPYDVVSVMNFKATAPAALVNWADYHLLFGLQHLVFVDNNCGEHMTAPAEAALSPYVDVGVATLVTRYRCLSFNDTFGAPQLRLIALTEAARASPLRGRMLPETLVLTIDDDEYIVLPNPSESLGTVAASMKRSRLCAANVLWRNYGDAGFTCQPQGAAVSSFLRRAPMWQEAGKHTAYIADAVRAAEAGSFSAGFRKGKVLLTWSMMRPCYRRNNPLGNAHMCDGSCRSFDSDYINCAASRRAKISDAQDPFKSASKYLKHLQRTTAAAVAPSQCFSFSGETGDPMAGGLAAGGVWINHYEFQSLDHWEKKKRRGRTNLNPGRRGLPPAYFNEIEDAGGALALQLRIRSVRSAPLRACLEREFSMQPGSAAAEQAYPSQPPRSSNVAAEHEIRSLRTAALGDKRAVLFLHFSGAAGSSLVSWLTQSLGLSKHNASSINANWGPDSRIPGHLQIFNASDRHSCEYLDAEIERGVASLFGHETPVLAPLRCKHAAIWVVMREPVDRFLSRMFKSRNTRKKSSSWIDNVGEKFIFQSLANTTWFDSEARGRLDLIGSAALNEPYTRSLLGPEAFKRPVDDLGEPDLAAAISVLKTFDLVLPMWALETIPFALGLPDHVNGPVYRVHNTVSTASTAVVSAELRDALGRHNKLDAQLYAHASQRYRTRVHQAALQLWPSAPPLPTSATPPPPAAAADGPARGPTALELCPAADFADALFSLSPLLPLAVARGGGLGALTARYARKFGSAVCPAARAAAGWPPSNRTGRLLLNMAEGTSGTRMVDCVLTKRGMRTAHFPEVATPLVPKRATAAGQLHPCTRGAGAESCTGQYDQYQYVSDTPVAQVAQLLLQTHSAAQVAAVLTLRDPWGWVVSRTNSHSQYNESEARAGRLTDDHSSVSVPCGCAWRPADRDSARMEKRKDSSKGRRKAALERLDGDAGVLLDTYEAPGCAAPTPLTRHTDAALDLLTHNAWTFCLARRRRVPLFAANLGEDMYLAQDVPGRDDARPLLSRTPHARHPRDSLFNHLGAFVAEATGQHPSEIVTGEEREQHVRDCSETDGAKRKKRKTGKKGKKGKKSKEVFGGSTLIKEVTEEGDSGEGSHT